MATYSLTTVANAAAQFLGVLDSGEALSTQQLADALAAANNMFDNWSSDGLFAIADLVTTWSTVAAQQSYTIGTGQTINITRPVRIVAAAVKLAAGPGNPLQVVSEAQWASLPDRQSQSWAPKYLFWDRGLTTTGLVYLSPIPLGIMTGEIHTWVPLTAFVDATTAITINPGYVRMIELGLAIELAPQYSMNPSGTLLQLFSDAAGRVRRLNSSLLGEVPPELAPPPSEQK